MTSVIARSECILRASRMASLAQRAVVRGNYDRCRRLAEKARDLMAALKFPESAAESSPNSGGWPGDSESAE